MDIGFELIEDAELIEIVKKECRRLSTKTFRNISCGGSVVSKIERTLKIQQTIGIVQS